MAKFFGSIGFSETIETSPSIWEEVVTERNYYGDIRKHGRRLEEGSNINDDVVIKNVISIVSDPYATGNIYKMRYLVWMGVKWKISSVEVEFPRLILTLGGIYNAR